MQSTETMGMKSTGGEIVQVQGGHIVRSTGRKDRHSKVYTAKGLRDRRVRLSAHTAIQFYDVQDRLGYDRPSKAVDWLIKKAKSAIDNLAELPPWHPPGTSNATPEQPDPDGGTAEMTIAEQSESSGYNFQLHRQLAENPDDNSTFIPPSLDSEAITDTLKSLFPTSSATSSINFQSYPPDITSRASNPSEEYLGLSLHSFQDHSTPNDHNLFSGSASMGFDINYQRMVAWNSDTSGEHRGDFVFNSQTLPQQALLGQGSAFSQRGPLQSSFAPPFRAWDDLPIATSDHHKTLPIHQSLVCGSRFATDTLSGFCIPATIRGEEERSANKPSSASSNSRH